MLEPCNDSEFLLRHKADVAFPHNPLARFSHQPSLRIRRKEILFHQECHSRAWGGTAILKRRQEELGNKNSVLNLVGLRQRR